MQADIDPAVWRKSVWKNRLQSLLLLALMAGFLALLGWLVWGPLGIWFLLGLGFISVFLTPNLSPRVIMRLYGAAPIPSARAPGIARAVAVLAERAGLKRAPDLYYVPSDMLNAFTVGTRDAAAIAMTDGILRHLTMRELIGVLAHETSHIRSNDVWVMGVADLFSRATSVLSLLGQILLLVNLPLLLMGETTVSWLAVLLLIFAPSLSALAQLALSRTREFDADLNAVRLTGDPDGLASALVKLERLQGGWLERIFAPGRRVPEPSLLRTHPHTEERIARLRTLRPTRVAPIAGAGEPVRAVGQPPRRRPRWHANGLWY